MLQKERSLDATYFQVINGIMCGELYHYWTLKKMTMNSISKLECRGSHVIRQLDPIDEPEEAKKAHNNDLYQIFGEIENQSALYMQSWLGFFVTVYHCFFAGKVSMYLKS